MKIEKLKIQFHTQADFNKLSLSILQQQYLADMQMGSSIYDLVATTANRGWLVNFRELYELVVQLIQHRFIENEEFYHYFNLIRLAETKEKSPRDNRHFAQIASHEPIDKKTEKILREASFFRSIDAEILDELLIGAQTIRVKPDQIICTEKSGDRDLYYLVSGNLAVFKTVGSSKKFVSILDPGVVFGETAYFLSHPRTADVVAMQESIVVQIPFRSDFVNQCLNQESAAKIVERFWVQHALIHSEIFKKIPADCFDGLSNIGTIVRFKNQSVIFSQNDLGDRAYCVIQGNLVVLQNNKKIQTLSQGSLFGEIALIVSGGRRTATIVCTTDVVLLEITQLHFYQLLAANLYLAQQIQSIAESRMKQDFLRKAN